MIPRSGTYQLSFNSGEIAEELYARTDVKSFYASCAKMSRFEPVPQGGFKLMDGTRHCGYAGRSVALGATGALTTQTSFNANDVVLTVALSSVVKHCGADITFKLTASVNDALRLQAFNLLTNQWENINVPIDGDEKERKRRLVLPPKKDIFATQIRLVALAACTVVSASMRALQETSASMSRLKAFKYDLDESYVFVLSPFHVDIWRDGVFVGASSLPHTASQVQSMTFTQRLDVLILWHHDVEPTQIKRVRGDNEWQTSAVAFKNLPEVDYGGSYTHISEQHYLNFQWEASVAGSVHFFTITVNTEETEAVEIPNPFDWAVTAAELQTKLLALQGIEAGVTVTVVTTGTTPTSQSLLIDFAGDNAGGKYIVTGRFTSTSKAAITTGRKRAGKRGGEAVMSALRGYPSCGTFFQERLIMGGFKSKRSAWLASVTGDYFDFNATAESASSAILIGLDTDGAEQILQIKVGRHLVFFTDSGSYYLSNQVLAKTIAPSLVKNSTDGVSQRVPVFENEGGLIFVNQRRTQVFSASFTAVAEAYAISPLSLLATHLIDNIVGADIQRSNADNDATRYLLVRDDGVLVVATLIQGQDVLSFSRWETHGKVKDIAVDGSEAIYVLVEREVNGVDTLFLERFEKGLWLDNAITLPINNSVNVMGLEAFEGQEVYVINDGFVEKPKTVAAGEITLDYECLESVTVGLWQAPILETLPLPREIGTRTVNRRKGRITTVQAFVLNSTSIALGANNESPRNQPLYYTGVPVDVPLAPQSRKVEVNGLRGFTYEPQAVFTQISPGALQVRDITLTASL
jgi:hypothetical protein